MNNRSGVQAPQPTVSLERFGALIGEWDMVGTHPGFPGPVHGHSTFEWLKQDALLLWHFNWERGGPPNAVSAIGHDDTVATATMLYTDERGVARIYLMSFEDGVWKMWRESPGFSQRMTGKFGSDGNMITVHGELSRDGSHWEQDLDITYTKRP